MNTKLSDEWAKTHFPYEVVARVNGNKIICDYGYDSNPIMTYTVLAYNEAIGKSGENILVMKNGVQIPPNDILEINPLSFWK